MEMEFLLEDDVLLSEEQEQELQRRLAATDTDYVSHDEVFDPLA